MLNNSFRSITRCNLMIKIIFKHLYSITYLPLALDIPKCQSIVGFFPKTYFPLGI